jgi:hypothetical protein
MLNIIVLRITIKLLDFAHRPDFYKQKTQRFGNWICFRLQARGGGGHLLYRKIKACLSTGDARTKEGLDKVQKLNSNECYTPSSEPFRMYSYSECLVNTLYNTVTTMYLAMN